MVSLKLNFLVLFPGVLGSSHVHLHTVIDDQVHGAEGVDGPGVASHSCHGIPHGGQIDDCRHAREILEDDSGRLEGDLDLEGGLFFPVQYVLDVFGFDFELVAVPNGTLEKDSNAVGQFFIAIIL